MEKKRKHKDKEPDSDLPTKEQKVINTMIIKADNNLIIIQPLTKQAGFFIMGI